MDRLSRAQTRRISELAETLGDQRFRALMKTSDTGRIIAPDRLARWQSGRGRLTAAEAERLQDISTNVPNLKKLAAKSEGKTRWKSNAAMRDWLAGEKEKGVPIGPDEAKKARARRAVKGLGYLGVDPSDGTYYVKRRK